MLEISSPKVDGSERLGGSSTAIGRSAWPVITLDAGRLWTLAGAGDPRQDGRRRGIDGAVDRGDHLSHVNRVARIGRSGTWQPAARAGLAPNADETITARAIIAGRFNVPSGPGHVALAPGLDTLPERKV